MSRNNTSSSTILLFLFFLVIFGQILRHSRKERKNHCSRECRSDDVAVTWLVVCVTFALQLGASSVDELLMLLRRLRDTPHSICESTSHRNSLREKSSCHGISWVDGRRQSLFSRRKTWPKRGQSTRGPDDSPPAQFKSYIYSEYVTPIFLPSAHCPNRCLTRERAADCRCDLLCTRRMMK